MHGYAGSILNSICVHICRVCVHICRVCVVSCQLNSHFSLSVCLSFVALVGSNASQAQSNYVEEDEDEEGGAHTFDESGSGSLTPSSKLALGSSYDISDWSVENFLPSGTK